MSQQSPKSDRKCILILGMHRSGSSLIAGILNKAGVDFKLPVFPVQFDNPKGFYEHIDIYNLNEEILKSLNSSYDDTNSLPPNWQNSNLDIYKKKLKEILQRDFSESSLFAIKDPRISLLFPLYKEVLDDLGINIYIIVTERPYNQIASSLEKRNGFSLNKSQLLIKKHYSSIESFLHQYPFLRIHMDDVIKSPEKTLLSIKKIFDLPINISSDVLNKINEFVTPSLKHHNTSDSEFENKLTKQKAFGNIEEKYLNIIENKDKLLSELIHDKKNIEAENVKLKNEIINLIENKKEIISKEKTLKEELQNKIEFYQNEANRTRERLKNMERSLLWKSIFVFEKGLNIILPPNTRLRYLYNKIIITLQDKVSLLIQNRKAKNNSENNNVVYKHADILFINHEETRTGAPRILFSIAKYTKNLIESKNSSFKSMAIVSKRIGNMHEEFAKEFPNIIYYPDENIFDGNRVKKALDVLSRIKPKFVYVNTIVPYEYGIAAKQLGIPVLIHVHDLDSGFKAIFGKRILEFPAYADFFIAVSEEVKKYLINVAKCPEEKIVLVNEFVEIDEVIKKSKETNKTELRNKLGIKPYQKMIVAVGTCIHRKGADIFVETASLAKKKYPGKYVFVWVGREPNNHDMFKLGNIDSTNYIHVQETDNPYQYIASADVFFLPSREDPFPLVVLEALALGIPVVLCKNGGGAHSAVINAGIITSSFEPKDFLNGITKITQKKEVWTELSNLAKKRGQLFNSTKKLPEIINCIDKILNEHKKSESLVSVILPSFNYENYLCEAIDSVIGQNYQNIELIIIDDHSKDSSPKIIEKYSLQYPEIIKVIKKPAEEKGLASSYKLAFSEAKGEFIAIIEADDIWNIDHLSKSVNALIKNPEAIIAYSEPTLIGEDKPIKVKEQQLKNEREIHQIPFGKIELAPFIKTFNPIHTMSSVVIKKEALKNINFSPKVPAWFDWWLYAQIVSKGPALHLDQKTTQWRIHSKSYNHSFLHGENGIGDNNQSKIAIEKICSEIDKLQQTKIEPIFIVGSARSGTSIMVQALRNSTNIPSFFEGHITSLFSLIMDTVKNYYKRKYMGPMKNARDVGIATLPESEIEEKIIKILKEHFEKIFPNKGKWIDKTANAEAVKAAPIILKLWPEAKFIFMKRRPIENMVSRLKKFPEVPFEQHCIAWQTAMREWLVQKKTLPVENYIEVEQRDVALKPKETAESVGRFLNLDEKTIEKIFIEFSTTRPQNYGGNEKQVLSFDEMAWKPEQKDMFKKICEPVATEYGYALDNRYYLKEK